MKKSTLLVALTAALSLSSAFAAVPGEIEAGVGHSSLNNGLEGGNYGFLKLHTNVNPSTVLAAGLEAQSIGNENVRSGDLAVYHTLSPKVKISATAGVAEHNNSVARAKGRADVEVLAYKGSAGEVWTGLGVGRYVMDDGYSESQAILRTTYVPNNGLWRLTAAGIVTRSMDNQDASRGQLSAAYGPVGRYQLFGSVESGRTNYLNVGNGASFRHEQTTEVSAGMKVWLARDRGIRVSATRLDADSVSRTKAQVSYFQSL